MTQPPEPAPGRAEPAAARDRRDTHQPHSRPADGLSGDFYDASVQAADLPGQLVERAAVYGLTGGLLLEMVRTYTATGVHALLTEAELFHAAPAPAATDPV